MINVDKKHPLLYYIIAQLQNSKLLDKIVVATTTKKDDDEIYNYVTNTKIDCFRGSELDVLDRYYQCAKKFSLSTIVRIPADKPLIDPHLMDKMITIFNSNSYEYVTNFLPLTFPSGTEVEIFSFESLETAWKNTVIQVDKTLVRLAPVFSMWFRSQIVIKFCPPLHELKP